MYELIYSRNALKALEKFERNIRERVIAGLEKLRIQPESHDIKRLAGMPGYRFRIGDYCIIFDLDKNKQQILVLKIGHRKNIYG